MIIPGLDAVKLLTSQGWRHASDVQFEKIQNAEPFFVKRGIIIDGVSPFIDGEEFMNHTPAIFKQDIKLLFCWIVSCPDGKLEGAQDWDVARAQRLAKKITSKDFAALLDRQGCSVIGLLFAFFNKKNLFGNIQRQCLEAMLPSILLVEPEMTLEKLAMITGVNLRPGKPSPEKPKENIFEEETNFIAVKDFSFQIVKSTHENNLEAIEVSKETMSAFDMKEGQPVILRSSSLMQIPAIIAVNSGLLYNNCNISTALMDALVVGRNERLKMIPLTIPDCRKIEAARIEESIYQGPSLLFQKQRIWLKGKNLAIVKLDPGPFCKYQNRSRILIIKEFQEKKQFQRSILGEAARQFYEYAYPPLMRPELFEQLGTNPYQYILLIGPDGSGKRSMVHALAESIPAKLHKITKLEGQMSSLAEIATSNEKTIVFIEHIDKLMSNQKPIPECLDFMDGLDLLKQKLHVIVVASAITASDIFAPLLDRECFDKHIEVGPLDSNSRAVLLRRCTQNVKLEIDSYKIVEMTNGFYGGELLRLCRLLGSEANMEKVMRAVKKTRAEKTDQNIPEQSNITWDESVGGLQSVRQEIVQHLIIPLRFPELYEKFGVQPSKGLLFYGPPGCGKTLIAKTIATEAHASFIAVQGPELISSIVGETGKNIKKIFQRARAAAPCVIFFDEVDSMAPTRDRSDNSQCTLEAITTLLTEMDGIKTKSKIFFIAATNRPDQLDSAFTRPGRFDRLIYIPLPDRPSRLMILEKALRKIKNVSKDIELAGIVGKTDGYSGADVIEIVQTASRLALRSALKHSLEPILKMKHLRKALEQSRKSVPPNELAYFEKFNKSQQKPEKPL